MASDVADEDRDGWVNRERSKKFARAHVFEPAEQPEGIRVPEGTNKRIPSEKIIGYWDDKEGKLHINPTWQAAQAL